MDWGCSLQVVGMEVYRGRPGALAGTSLRPELPPAENPGIKCVFGSEFRVYKPYLYGGLTGSRIWAFWRDFERAGWINTKKFDHVSFRWSWETRNFGNFWNFRPKLKTLAMTGIWLGWRVSALEIPDPSQPYEWNCITWAGTTFVITRARHLKGNAKWGWERTCKMRLEAHLCSFVSWFPIALWNHLILW
jgi:hypothetical protein